jgi:hypothetical protein
MRKLIATAVVSAALLASHRSAGAAICASLTLTDASEDVIIGEAGYKQCFGGPSPGCFFMPYSPAKLGVCRKAAGGTWQMSILGCTSSSTASDAFFLQTRGGDDRVAVLRDEHTLGYLDLLPAGGGTGAMYCGGAGDAVAPWNPNFDFQILAYLGTGADLYHGSDNTDVVWTNAPIYSGGVWTSPADAASFDMACTYKGDDTFYGDGDDNFAAGFEDWIDAGLGNDFCDGDYGTDGSDVSDLQRSCEGPQDLYSDLPYVNAIQCDASDDPLHEW